MPIVNALLIVASVLVLIPMAVWSIECAAGLWAPPRRVRPISGSRPAIAILVPAHDEAAVIGATLADLALQKGPDTRIVVIADNCGDDTAVIARNAGALVLERHDTVLKGKSYALDYAVRTLERDMPDVFVVIDADCSAQPGAIELLATQALATGRPVQASYVMELPARFRPLQPLAALAFLIKNHVRPCGLDRLGLPCFLNGSGMAFPAASIRHPMLASGSISEDKWLTVDLALSGCPPLFCRGAKVTSRLPERKHAESTQRTRWIHGHLECMYKQGPRLLREAVRRRSIDLAALLLELYVPPLSLLMVAWLATLTAALAAGLSGAGWLPAMVSTAGGLSMAVSLTGVVWRFGERSTIRAFGAVPEYILSRARVFGAYLVRRERNWVKTGRDPGPPAD